MITCSNNVLTSNDKWNRTPLVNSSRSSPPSKLACSKMSSTWLLLPLLNDVCYSCLAAIVQTQLAMLGLAYFFQLGPLYFGLGFLDLLLFFLPGPSGILRTMTFPPPLAMASPSRELQVSPKNVIFILPSYQFWWITLPLDQQLVTGTMSLVVDTAIQHQLWTLHNRWFFWQRRKWNRNSTSYLFQK